MLELLNFLAGLVTVPVAFAVNVWLLRVTLPWIIR
jgi:hypothetical protein